jgi:hypothetical protein
MIILGSQEKLEFSEQTLLDVKLPILTNNQKRLNEELLNILNSLKIDKNYCVLNLKEFLDSNKNDKDLKFVLNRTQYEIGKLYYITLLNINKLKEQSSF